MKWILVLPFFLLVACTQPFVMIPGGQLKGQTTAVPKTWVSVPEVVQLETRPSKPYSVNIWALVDHGSLYLATRDARWVPYVADDNLVRVKIEDSIYELRAHRVNAPAELQSLVIAYQKKYDVDPADSWIKDAQAYQLTAR